MYDMSSPNLKPGVCSKCSGKGIYAWGATTNGKPDKVGPCWSCKGTGKQTQSDIARNKSYNRHKLSRILAY